jgi:hypothetical protein
VKHNAGNYGSVASMRAVAIRFRGHSADGWPFCQMIMPSVRAVTSASLGRSGVIHGDDEPARPRYIRHSRVRTLAIWFAGPPSTHA